MQEGASYGAVQLWLMRGQLHTYPRGIVESSHSLFAFLQGPARDLEPVRKALASGLFINAARLTDELDVRMSGGWVGVFFPATLQVCLCEGCR